MVEDATFFSLRVSSFEVGLVVYQATAADFYLRILREYGVFRKKTDVHSAHSFCSSLPQEQRGPQ